MIPEILVIDDEQQICRMIATLLAGDGYRVSMAHDAENAQRLLDATEYDLVFCDIMLKREGSGLDLLRQIKQLSPTSQVIMMTGYPDVASAAEATRHGAFDYLCKPFDAQQIKSITRHAIEQRRLQLEKDRYRANLEAIYRSIDDAIVMVDSALVLQYLNNSAYTCGYDHQNIGTPLDRLTTGCQGSCRMALAETVRTGRRQELKRIECRRSGHNRVVNVVTSPIIDQEGNLEGAVAVIRDETVLHSLERTLQQRSQFQGLIGRSAPMQRLYSQIEALADVSSTVLICGESGTGKELVARALHECGSRRGKPFVAVNCAALSDSLLESELFGHVRGAFTGAIHDKQGRFQRAHRGTIFLDEIGDISPAMQVRLLRVLQEHEIERLGDNIPIPVDVRVIAATNCNLLEKVRTGEFRSDLFYRLNVVQVITPALRERLEDIPLLAEHFLKKFSNRFQKSFSNLSDDLLSALQHHTWPGNVRELEHVLERACIMSKTSLLTSDLLPHDFAHTTAESSSPPPQPPRTPVGLPQTMAALSIDDALQIAKGNKTEAARLLGISRRTLYRWLDQQ